MRYGIDISDWIAFTTHGDTVRVSRAPYDYVDREIWALATKGLGDSGDIEPVRAAVIHYLLDVAGPLRIPCPGPKEGHHRKWHLANRCPLCRGEGRIDGQTLALYEMGGLAAAGALTLLLCGRSDWYVLA